MSISRLNDAPVLDQTNEHYQKLFAILVWKLQQLNLYPNGVTITARDIEAYGQAYARGEVILYAHGHPDSFEFKNVSRERADELAKWQATQKGHA
jgi:hypothetical protein